VKFYTGAAIPDTPEHRRVLRSMVERLAGRQPVVALGAGVRLDEHEDYIFGGVPNVIAIDQAMQPQANLAVQTEVIRRSSLFVGTAGSLAWLAPMLGVDTVAAYADDRFLGPHLYAARYGYASIRAGRFMPLDLHATARLDTTWSAVK
jgi:ADP-heptose:LPS heptosyltransferase